MRDLTSEETIHVYGAGSRGKSPRGPCPPKKRRNRCRGGSGSGSGHKRCKGGKGGSS
jgi:hypothetical protein